MSCKFLGPGDIRSGCSAGVTILPSAYLTRSRFRALRQVGSDVVKRARAVHLAVAAEPVAVPRGIGASPGS